MSTSLFFKSKIFGSRTTSILGQQEKDSSGELNDLMQSERIESTISSKEKLSVEKPLGIIFGHSDIFAEAMFWARSNWTSDMPAIHSILINPGLYHMSASLRKFMSAIESSNLNLSTNDSYIFSWHGTGTKQNIHSICDVGFDPSLRRSQSYGPGEYFGVNPTVCRSFCASSNFIIVAVVACGPWLRSFDGRCHVVENPLCFKMTYVLPILVVNFGALDTLTFKTY